jgi:PPOX class probable F420-dependent enzyme
MMDAFDLDRLFAEANVAVLATVGPGDHAHAMPIWYLYENGLFVMIAGDSSQKARNIRRHGEATLVIDRRELPYHAAMVRGRATLSAPPTEELRLRMAVRYLGEGPGLAYHDRTTADDSVTITLHPDEVIEFEGSAGRSST